MFSVQGQTENEVIPDTSYVEALLDDARQFKSVSDYDSTIILAKKADIIAEDILYEEGQLKAIIVLSETYNERYEFTKAEEVLAGALQRFANSDQLARLYKLKGEVLYNQGDIIGAMPVLEKALGLANRIPDESSREQFLATMYQTLATTHMAFGNMNESFENFLKAIDFAESRSDSLMLTLLYNNLGGAYEDVKEYEKSQYYLEKSMEMARSINSKVNESRAILNLANVSREQGKYTDALAYYDQAAVLWEELRPNAPPAIIIHNKGATLSRMGRFKEAEDLLFRSLEMSESIQLPQGIYFNHLELSRLYENAGQLEKSVFHIEQALPLARGSGSLSTLTAALQQAQKVYASAGRYQKAYNTLVEDKALTDSLKTIEKEKELSELKSTFEISRQQEINELLEEKQTQQERQIRVQNILIGAAILIILLIAALLIMARKTTREKQELLEELRDRKDELEQLNQAKDRVFAIVSHDLRSPLTSVQGVLELVKDEILKGDELKQLVQDIDQSVQENVDVIEDLLTWAKDQLSGLELQSGEVDLEPLVKDVLTSQSFMAIRKDISLESNLREQKIKGDVNATRIIFRNLISNAIKYTEKGDTITVNATENKDSVTIMVKDNGIGIPKESAQKIFNSRTWTREGTKNEKGSGFGLSLSKEFTEKMGGKIWFESEEGEGTTFYVELPKA
tara:strand:- start:2166 stop:4217 length:2052 start_codon:yes stop_codon:yes gene_type:complete